MNDIDFIKSSLQRVDQMISEILSIKDMQTRIEEIKMLARAIHEVAEPSELKINPIGIKSYFMPFVLRLARNSAN